ncbi:2-(3-amino-3-carboxypropyl)histidine synthase [Enteropsectra breve]|nr:2-(3-amino-3-carboxypropyl)histidine synthase [Enteropsectra breve]
MIILEENSDFPENLPGLPKNYNFEVRKTLRTIKKLGAKRVNLQFPDGLLSYAPILIDAIEHYTGASCTILDDVVYGACCVDDRSISCDILVHYGHSCLVPVTEMSTRLLYIFVEIAIDIEHLYDIIVSNFTGPVAIIGTIQFNTAVNKLKRLINQRQRERISCCGMHGDGLINASINKTEFNKTETNEIRDSDNCINKKCCNSCSCVSSTIPQVKPLSPGEVLGCTSPVINSAENVVYIGDGRFHLESAMIRNPGLNFYKYCPFTRKISQEFYDNEEMLRIRKAEIKKAFAGKSFGVILGTLGRQGNSRIVENVIKKLGKRYKIYRIVIDEINETILDQYHMVDSFVQVSCPRLSIDWGACYRKPLLSPFEVFYAKDGEYQMDYYSMEGSAPWKNYNNAE